MGKIVTEEITFDDLDLPPVIYKYRTFSNPFHRSILTGRQVYLCPPKGFEDKLDCKIPLRFDLLSSGDIFSMYYYDALKANPFLSQITCMKIAKQWFTESPARNPTMLKRLQDEQFEEFNKRVGILSLTANCKSIPMWAKYSENGKGFCVGFDPKIMFPFLGGGSVVKYFEELPEILPSPWHSYEEQMYYQVYSKLKKWEFEEEYRTQKFAASEFKQSERTIELPLNAFKEIILGYNISEEHETEIRRIASQQFPEVMIKKAVLNNGTIEF